MVAARGLYKFTGKRHQGYIDEWEKQGEHKKRRHIGRGSHGGLSGKIYAKGDNFRSETQWQCGCKNPLQAQQHFGHWWARVGLTRHSQTNVS